MIREGSLEAPTRHPIDWHSPDFYSVESALKEMERVFDICHGCRRCVSLCNAFPVLFELVDNSPTMEVDGVDKSSYWKVVDQCYLCDVCYMTKCPYVPPHPWNLDFPHLMLRAKAIQFKQGTPTKFRDSQLSSTDRNGKLATIPVVVQFANAAVRNQSLRKLADSLVGVHEKAWLPSFSKRPFRKTAGKAAKSPQRDSAASHKKVAIFSTCYVNYNEPGIGHDLVKVLDHMGISPVILQSESCCGMPKLELGDLQAVDALRAKNIPMLAKLAADGYEILSPIPSCTLMFKQELPLLFHGDGEVTLVSKAFRDPFEYFMTLKQAGQLPVDFKIPIGSVAYHIPCHSRVQNVGQKTREFLELIPGTSVHTVERCSGHAGTWGVKKEFHETAMKIGRPVFRQMNEVSPDFISSDCQLAARHIEQGISAISPEKLPQVAHPLTLARRAYGLSDEGTE